MSERTAEQIAEEALAKAKGKTNGKTPPHVERGEGAALLDDVSAFLKRFIAYPSEQARVAHVLWIAHTHSWARGSRHRALRSCLRSRIGQDPLDGSVRIARAGTGGGGKRHARILFRKCGSKDGPPTILFDEIDTVFGARAKGTRRAARVVELGHRRGAKAGRCVVRGKIVETEEISSVTPPSLWPGLAGCPTRSLAGQSSSACAAVRPTRRIEAFRRRVHAPQGEALRRRLAGWAVTVRDEATEARPKMPAGVEDRDADVWEPLLALADIAGDGWPQRAREAAVALIEVVREEEPSLDIRLLADLRAVFGNAEEMSSKDILQALAALDEAPWGDINGKPLDARGLANHLRPYGVKSITVRPPGETKTSRATSAPPFSTPGGVTFLPLPPKVRHKRHKRHKRHNPRQKPVSRRPMCRMCRIRPVLCRTCRTKRRRKPQ